MWPLLLALVFLQGPDYDSDGIKALELAEAAARSWREGQAVAVNI